LIERPMLPTMAGMASKQEVRRIVEGYAKSGMTRRQYCEKHNIPITTLDYWRPHSNE
jgi:hypothetical protein